MSNSKTFFAQFLALHRALVTEKAIIPFDPRWKNGTGYLDGAVRTAHLNDGDVKAFTDDAVRRGIIVGTPAGNLVVFERYSSWSNTDAPEVLVSNQPAAVQDILLSCDTSWTRDTWEACFPNLSWAKPTADEIVGHCKADNIGHTVANIGKAIQARSNWVNNPNKKSKD